MNNWDNVQPTENSQYVLATVTLGEGRGLGLNQGTVEKKRFVISMEAKGHREH